MEKTTIQPDAVKKAWMELGYGMFLHIGPNTFEGRAWGDGRFPAEGFCPTKLNPHQWAEVAADVCRSHKTILAKHQNSIYGSAGRKAACTPVNATARPNAAFYPTGST